MAERRPPQKIYPIGGDVNIVICRPLKRTRRSIAVFGKAAEGKGASERQYYVAVRAEAEAKGAAGDKEGKVQR